MTGSESSFLKNTVLAAQQSQRSSGIPASITIAQAILESGWGQSALAKKANNFFGVKAASGLDPESYMAFETSEYIDGREVRELANFARYPSPVESFVAHSALLSKAARYKSAMAQVCNPLGFAAALQRCGYSTSPNYAAELIELVKEFDLTQYDVSAVPIAQPIVTHQSNNNRTA